MLRPVAKGTTCSQRKHKQHVFATNTTGKNNSLPGCLADIAWHSFVTRVVLDKISCF